MTASGCPPPLYFVPCRFAAPPQRGEDLGTTTVANQLSLAGAPASSALRSGAWSPSPPQPPHISFHCVHRARPLFPGAANLSGPAVGSANLLSSLRLLAARCIHTVRHTQRRREVSAPTLSVIVIVAQRVWRRESPAPLSLTCPQAYRIIAVKRIHQNGRDKRSRSSGGYSNYKHWEQPRPGSRFESCNGSH